VRSFLSQDECYMSACSQTLLLRIPRDGRLIPTAVLTGVDFAGSVAQFFLGAFAKLLKATVCFVMSICLSVRPSARLHGTNWLPLDGFSCNEHFSKICKENPIFINPLNPELNPICYLLALLAHHFLHVSRIRVKSLTIRLLMSYIYGAPILDVSRSHTTTQHSR